jgi:hypothetical protein
MSGIAALAGRIRGKEKAIAYRIAALTVSPAAAGSV